ncbi:MAG: hypothetical protein IPN91_01480 [Holophagaceae bacterium]|uniref:Uncharacterized protein n=1 Tax=Candidatus Geothrix odensensis TaxID=2954440 RepID=A0A936EZT2_9BACT|nr:hypothetical protein [Candidatus Geothrix odensensis]
MTEKPQLSREDGIQELAKQTSELRKELLAPLPKWPLIGFWWSGLCFAYTLWPDVHVPFGKVTTSLLAFAALGFLSRHLDNAASKLDYLASQLLNSTDA